MCIDIGMSIIERVFKYEETELSVKKNLIGKAFLVSIHKVSLRLLT